MKTLLRLLLIVGSVGMAETADARPAGDKAIPFLLETEGNVRAEIHPTPLDTSVTLDALVQSTVDELNKLYGLDTKVWWAADIGACAHPKLGIVLDRAQLDGWKADVEPSQFEEILRLVIAHEEGHMMQYKAYGADVVLQAEHTRENEAQADILAGYYATTLLLAHNQSLAYASNTITKWYEFAQKTGCVYGSAETHPYQATRARLVTLGVLARMQDFDMFFYGQDHDAARLKRIRDTVAGNKDLPDPETPYRVGKWSKEAAKRIVNWKPDAKAKQK